VFIKKVRSLKAEKILKKRRDDKIADMAVTYVPYSDKKYWANGAWVFMVNNIRFRAVDGFYISSNLFKVNNVSNSKKVVKIRESTVVA